MRRIFNKKSTFLFSVFAAIFVAFLWTSTPVKAANPNIISFQGKVVNADGTNVTNGSYNFDFIMWDDPTAGTNRWQELTKSVTVTNGVFQTNLGSATALPDFNAYPDLYLAVRFNADSNGYMTPRIQMASVPYALNADKVGGVAASSIVQLGASQSGNIDIGAGTLTSGLINGQTISSSANFTGTLAVGGASVTIGAAAQAGALVLFDNGAGSETVTFGTQDISTSYVLNLPTAIGGLSECLKTGAGTASDLVFGSCGGGSSPFQTTSNVVNLVTSTDSLTIGSATALGKLAVDGDADEVQLLVQGNGTQTTNLVVFETSGGTDLFSLSGSGAALFQNSVDSTAAFQIQNAAGTALLAVDSSNLIVRPGIASSATNISRTTTELANADNVGQYSSIAIGTDGLPVISHHNITDLDLNVTKCGNAACSSGNTTTELANADSVGHYSSIAIGTDGLPVISHHNITDLDLNITKCGNASCSSGNTTTELSNADSVGIDSSIAIGTDGLPVISYYNTTDGDLNVTKCGNAACSSGNTTTELTNADNVGQYSSIAIGTDGLPVISYKNASDGDLNVTKCGNASCSSGNTTTELSNANSVGNYSSIAIGTDGLPVISYRNTSDLDLNVTKCGNASCSSGNTTTELSTADDDGNYNSIAIGTDGLPVISYWNSPDLDLNITKCGNASCSSGNTTTELTNADSTGTYSSIAIGTDGLPVISHRNSTDSALNVTKCADRACANATGDSLNVGVDLGTSAAAFRGLYVDTINMGKDNARIRLDELGNFSVNNLSVNNSSQIAVLGAEKVTNGTFTGSATGWTLGTGWSYSSNTVVKAAGSASNLSQNVSAVKSEIYQVTFVLSSVSAGCVTPTIGGVAGSAVCVNGTLSQVFTATGTGDLIFSADTAFAGTIDTVSVMKITAANSILTVSNSDATSGLEVRSGGTGLSNSLIGNSAGQNNITGAFNTAVSGSSLFSNTTGNLNVALGFQTLYSNTTGSNNTGTGTQALFSNNIGSDNTAVGKHSLFGNTTGSSNTAVGKDGLLLNSSGSFNTAVGQGAIYTNTTGSNNTAMGYSSMLINNTGSNNTALGYNAFNTDATFSSFTNLTNSTAIGYQAQVQASNSLVLGGQGATAVNVGIGTTIPTSTFSVSPSIMSTGSICQFATGGSCSGGATTTITGSGGATFTSAMVGDELVWADGTKDTILTVPTGTTLTVATSRTHAASSYRIHSVGLQVTSGGKVGIGAVPTITTTTGAVYALQVDAQGGTDGIVINGTVQPELAFANAGTIMGRFALATSAGSYSTDSNVNDFVFRVDTTNILFNANGGAAGASLTVKSDNVIVGSTTTDTTQILFQHDSFSTFADTATCNTTTNQGALYYNTSTNVMRGCVNGAWEDMVSTAGLGLQLFGVVPDSGSNPGDLAAVTGVQNGPCKVSVGTNTSTISWTACTAYSAGRKVLITAGTQGTSSGTSAANIWQHLCLTGTGNQPALSAVNTEVANLSTVSMPSVAAPILCLADVRVTNGSAVITAVYDTRTYTTTTKETISIGTTAPALGHLIQHSTTKGVGVPNTTATGTRLAGVVVATTGATSTTTINGIIAISGPAAVKAITGTNTVGVFILGTTTAGYANGSATKPAESTSTIHNVIGAARTAWSGGSACSANADTCAGSYLTSLDKR